MIREITTMKYSSLSLPTFVIGAIVFLSCNVCAEDIDVRDRDDTIIKDTSSYSFYKKTEKFQRVETNRNFYKVGKSILRIDNDGPEYNWKEGDNDGEGNVPISSYGMSW